MKTRLLLVDDQQSILYFLRKTLAAEGYDVRTAERGDLALEAVRESLPDVVVLDMKLPDTNGLSVLRELRSGYPHIPVIMMTAFGDVQSSVEAMKLGAMDYLNKPVQLEELLDLLEGATARRLTSAPQPSLPREAAILPTLPAGFASPSQERSMHEVQARARALVQSPDFLLLLEGEPGTGRGSLARWAHANSPRAALALVEFQLAAHAPARHSELLFDGPDAAWKKAEGGALFLEHLELLETTAQMRLAAALDKERGRGLVACSDADLAREAELGRLRPELIAHLSPVRLRVPPLRRRRADILPLAEQFLREHARAAGRMSPALTAGAKELLLNHAWTGNIRELKSMLAAALLLSHDGTVDVAQLVLPSAVDESSQGVLERIQDAIEASLPVEGIDFESLVTDLERSLIEKAFRASDGNQSQTAKLLNMNRDKLRYRMKSFQLL